MPDPYLEAMMRGEFSRNKNQFSKKIEKEKNRFEIAFDKNIEKIMALRSTDTVNSNSLMSDQLKSKRLEDELREALKLDELNKYIDNAIMLIANEGRKYLDHARYEDLLQKFSKIPEILDQLDFELPITEDFDKILGLGESARDNIFNIAFLKFDEKQYLDALSLFALLAVLQPENFEYWYRLGIAAQQSENYILAVNAYEAAFHLNSALIGSRLFAIECYLQLDQLSQAKTSLAEAQKILEISSVDQVWNEIFGYASLLIKEKDAH